MENLGGVVAAMNLIRRIHVLIVRSASHSLSCCAQNIFDQFFFLFFVNLKGRSLYIMLLETTSPSQIKPNSLKLRAIVTTYVSKIALEVKSHKNDIH